MSMITTPVLKDIARQVDDNNTVFCWLNVYAAEFVVKGLEGSERGYASELAMLVCNCPMLPGRAKYVCL